MSADTAIEWTDATWNPVRGCSRVSEGCRNCYAERVAARFSGPGMPYEGLATIGKNGPRWTGQVRFIGEHLADPLRWRRPRRIFVNSMSDLFHDGVTDEQIAAVFGVMSAASHHTFQVLTKRPERMRRFMAADDGPDLVAAACAELDRVGFNRGCGSAFEPDEWPPRNVWLGVSVEDQATADERIPHLLETPAAVRFLSVEPMLGPVDFTKVPGFNRVGLELSSRWVICGGESGPGARPMQPEWVRAIREQCRIAAVPFFFKQWGGVNKKAAGRELDGRTWDEMPRVQP